MKEEIFLNMKTLTYIWLWIKEKVKSAAFVHTTGIFNQPIHTYKLKDTHCVNEIKLCQRIKFQLQNHAYKCRKMTPGRSMSLPGFRLNQLMFWGQSGHISICIQKLFYRG